MFSIGRWSNVSDHALHIRFNLVDIPFSKVIIEKTRQNLFLWHVAVNIICFIFCPDPAVGVWIVLDVHNDLIIASCSSPNTPNYLVRQTPY